MSTAWPSLAYSVITEELRQINQVRQKMRSNLGNAQEEIRRGFVEEVAFKMSLGRVVGV